MSTEYNPLFLLPLLVFIIFLLLDKCNCKSTKFPSGTGLAFVRGVLAYEEWKRENENKKTN